MPRLLLVDDNPSIHRIAESLMAPTDVELVCVDSAAEALDRIGRGEHFDVALVDTAMPGMDGWTLLARLREVEATARMPIALMAGVLDPVDPARLAKAPIQGFLKKPIELRELGDRVRALLATPVATSMAAPVAAAEPPAPKPPAPEVPASGLPVFVFPPPPPAAEAVAPVPLPPQAPQVFEAPFAPLDLTPEPAAPAHEPVPAEPEDDLLVLTAEDLWPEEAAVEAAPAPAALPVTTTEVHLELEELDLEGLQDLAPPPALELPAAPLAVPPIYTHELPPVETEAPAEALAEESLSFSGLETFDGLGGDLELPPLPEPAKPEPPPVKAEGGSVLPLVGGAAAVAGLAAAAVPFLEKTHEPQAPALPVPAPFHEPIPEPRHEPGHEPMAAIHAEHPVMPVIPEPVGLVPVAAPAIPPTPVVEAVHAAPGQAPAASGQAAPLAPSQVQALLADPAVMDALVKAVVARMGDQVVREIAWEIMPELAGKLQK